MSKSSSIRRIDQLGRIVLPTEVRAALDLKGGDALCIEVRDQAIVLRKYHPTDVFTGTSDDLIEYKGKYIEKETIRTLAALAGLLPDAQKNTP